MAASFSEGQVPMYFLNFPMLIRTCQFCPFLDTPVYMDLLLELSVERVFTFLPLPQIRSIDPLLMSRCKLLIWLSTSGKEFFRFLIFMFWVDPIYQLAKRWKYRDSPRLQESGELLELSSTLVEPLVVKLAFWNPTSLSMLVHPWQVQYVSRVCMS